MDIINKLWDRNFKASAAGKKRKTSLSHSQRGLSEPESCELLWEGEKIPYTLYRDGCRTLRLRVRQGGVVEVRAPRRVRGEEIFAFLMRKASWIQQKRVQLAESVPPAPSYADGEIWYYVGRPFMLRGEIRAGRSGAELSGGILLMHGRSLAEEERRRLLAAWRQRQSARLLSARLKRLHGKLSQIPAAPLWGIPCPTLKVRVLKRRFGSCSLRGEVTLARHLSAYPLNYIDYVIIHELCHLRQMNHSAQFYALLEQCLPGAAYIRKELLQWAAVHPKE